MYLKRIPFLHEHTGTLAQTPTGTLVPLSAEQITTPTNVWTVRCSFPSHYISTWKKLQFSEPQTNWFNPVLLFPELPSALASLGHPGEELLSWCANTVLMTTQKVDMIVILVLQMKNQKPEKFSDSSTATQ